MNYRSITALSIAIALVVVSTPIPVLADLGTVPNRPIDRAINTALHLEASWHTTLNIDATPERDIRVEIPIDNITYTLELEPYSVRSEGYTLFMQDDSGELYEVPAGPIRTLRGSVVGIEGSVVAASLMEDGLHARIRFSNDVEYWMEPVGLKVDRAPSNLYAFYRNEDIIPSGGVCAAKDRVDVSSILEMQANYGANNRSRGGGGNIICTAELGVDADYEYYQDWGGQTEDRINQVVNAINLQYENQVNLTHSISSIIVRSSPNDPYTSNNAETLLDQFRSEWQNNQGGIPHDIAHLFTGKSMNGSTIGIAWLSSVCSSVKYGLSESDCCGSFGCSTDLTAHELGHGWGSGHCDCTSFTMNPYITCSNQFTNSSINAINSFANSAGCLTCGPAGTPGACCIDNQCSEVFQSDCVSSGGDYQGDNITCSQTFCVVLTGACCINYNCSVLEQVDCNNSGGVYQGTDVPCDGIICAEPTGACCVNNACQTLTSANCSSANGTYNGDNSSCDTTGCTVGACCVGTSCSITLQDDCGGSWYGDNTSCANVSCDAVTDQLNYELRTWSRSDGQEMETYDLYFPSTDPNSRMVSVFGEEADYLQVRALSNADFDGSATSSALHHSQYGSDIAHDRQLDGPLGDDVKFDSYVTVGADDSAIGIPIVLGFDSTGFNNSTGAYMTNGVWFVTPDDPLALIGAGSTLGHRLISLSVESGQGVEMTTNIQWFDGAGVVHESRNIYWNNLGLGGGPECPTDVNGDGATTVSDLLIMIGDWGACNGCASDIDGNGIVNVSDLLVAIGAWGACP